MHTCNNSCSWAHLTALLGAHLCKTLSRKEVSILNTYSKGWFKVRSLSQAGLGALGICLLLVKETIKGTSHLTNLILIGNTTQTWYSSGYPSWMRHLLQRPQSQQLIKVNSYNINIREFGPYWCPDLGDLVCLFRTHLSTPALRCFCWHFTCQTQKMKGDVKKNGKQIQRGQCLHCCLVGCFFKVTKTVKKILKRVST